MKKETIFKAIGLPACAIVAVLAAFYVKDNEFHTYPDVQTQEQFHTYETTDTTYKNAEVLLPDAIHTDTLVVQDAELLNLFMADSTYNQSNEDITALLHDGCVVKK